MRGPTWRLLAAALAAPAALSSAARAQYEPPASYYAPADGLSGTALRNALHEIIRGHSVVSYANARWALQVLDPNPSNPNELRLFYTGEMLNLLPLSASGINGWDTGASWQREHVWPRSRQVAAPGDPTDTGADFSDLHMLRPIGSINQTRSNLNFGGNGSGVGGTSPLAGTTNVGGVTYFYPGVMDRGDAARAAMYAAVRYDGRDANTVNLQLVNGNPASATGQLGDLQSLLRYHYEDPPDLPERRRNHLIFSAAAWASEPRPANWNGGSSYTQGNRNPFIDRPELAWSVFSPTPNDSQISAGVSAVDLGRVIAGAVSSTLTATVPLSKTGSAPTYYEVVPAGGARASNSGRFNAFSFGPQNATSTVWLDTPTTTAGLRSGHVTYRNLDVTSSGPGRGSADADDVVHLTLTVLAPGRASLDAAGEVKSLSVNFGAVDVGSAATQTLRLHNLVSVPGFTAGLDIDAVTLTPTPPPGGVTGHFGSSAATVFTTDLSPTLTPIDAGAFREFSVTFSPAHGGAFAATLTVAVSDEDLPGAMTRPSLVVQLSGVGVVVVPEPAGLAVLVMAAGWLGVSGRRARR